MQTSSNAITPESRDDEHPPTTRRCTTCTKATYQLATCVRTAARPGERAPKPAAFVHETQARTRLAPLSRSQRGNRPRSLGTPPVVRKAAHLADDDLQRQLTRQTVHVIFRLSGEALETRLPWRVAVGKCDKSASSGWRVVPGKRGMNRCVCRSLPTRATLLGGVGFLGQRGTSLERLSVPSPSRE